jgi:hypothetical protein
MKKERGKKRILKEQKDNINVARRASYIKRKKRKRGNIITIMQKKEQSISSLYIRNPSFFLFSLLSILEARKLLSKFRTKRLGNASERLIVLLTFLGALRGCLFRGGGCVAVRSVHALRRLAAEQVLEEPCDPAAVALHPQSTADGQPVEERTESACVALHPQSASDGQSVQERTESAGVALLLLNSLLFLLDSLLGSCLLLLAGLLGRRLLLLGGLFLGRRRVRALLVVLVAVLLGQFAEFVEWFGNGVGHAW